jgi:hypothetical protein
MANFIEVGNQLVREDAITRLSQNLATGHTDTLLYYVHFADGGSVLVREQEYSSLRRKLSPPKRIKKGAAA